MESISIVVELGGNVIVDVVDICGYLLISTQFCDDTCTVERVFSISARQLFSAPVFGV